MPKTRSSTTRRRTTRRTRRKANPIPVFDIIGVLLIVLGLMTLISLFSKDTGMLGRLAPAARSLVGIGAYIIPFLVALFGAFCVVGPLRIISRNILMGSVMVFLAIVGWASLVEDIPARLDKLRAAGGYIGNGVAWLVHKAGGNVGGYILLTALALIGVIMIVDRPLANLIDWIRLTWSDASKDAAERAKMRREAREKRGKEKPKEPVVVSESRKRTLASIFGKSEEADSEPEKTPVRINGPGVVGAKDSSDRSTLRGVGRKAAPTDRKTKSR